MLVIFGCQFPQEAISYGADLRCKVIDAVFLDDSGALTRPGELTQQRVGKEFSVDGNTGVMVGAVKNSNAHGTPEVIDPGSEDQSFTVMTVYSPYRSVDLLSIQVFAEGSVKPFLFRASFDQVLSGICRVE